MAKIALDLSQFKSAGVYTVEIDQSERIQVTTQTLRLVPGFSAKGPYNAPVFIRNTKDLYRIYGGIDTKLERKGSFFHRTIETCLLTAPVFAINLLKISTIAGSGDNIQYVPLMVEASTYTSSVVNIQDPSALSSDYINFFNRERFWKPDETYLQGVVNNSVLASDDLSAPLFSVVNIGTKDISFIIRKATGLSGYGVTATDWYGSAANIPYEWIRPYDLMEDYFIQVIAIEGNWTNYANLAADPYYSSYFKNTSDASGLTPSKLSGFINADNVGLLGSWTGTLIPDFKDQTGAEQFLPTVINGASSLTGVYCTVNRDALDQLIWDEDSDQWESGDGTGATAASYLVDLVGHAYANDRNGSHDSIKFLSYDIDVSDNILHYDANVTMFVDSSTAANGKKFFLDASTADNLYIKVGAFVSSAATIQPGLTVITNKYRFDSSIVIETADPVYGWSTTGVDASLVVQLPIEDASINRAYKMIHLAGFKLRNKHVPGYDVNGTKNAEAGLDKIYGMLHDSGILRGLTNPDMINYRYVVDTMAYGLGANLGGKQHLSNLAKKRGKCMAIISAPAMKQLAASQNPYFVDTYVSGVDPKPIFNTAWIPEGGNPDMARTFKFTMPSEELGAKYCGIFGPFLRYNENGKLIDVPPAADVANAYARKFLGGNPFAIVANRNGILSNPKLSGVEYMIDKQDRDSLEPWGYNSIIERPATGQIMLYSNATGYQSVKSDYNNLHVRELLNTLELQIDEILQNYVFDFNNAVTRLNIINSISPILETTKDAGAIYKYELVMDDTNNTAAIIADGFGIVDVGLWITGALTKIVAQFTVNSEGAVSSGGYAG